MKITLSEHKRREADRIREVLDAAIKKAGKHPSSFATEIGRPKDYISDFLNGKKQSLAGPETSMIEDALGLMPGTLVPRRYYSVALVKSFDPDAPEPVEADQQPPSARPPDGIVELSTRASMGPGQFAETGYVVQNGDMTTVDAIKDEYWHFPSTFLREQLQVSPKSLIVIECVGDSMSTTLEPGDRVLVDTSVTRPANDGLYALRNEWDTVVVKRVSTIPGRPIRLRISSDNPNHQSYEVDPADVTVIGKVVTGLRKF